MTRTGTDVRGPQAADRLADAGHAPSDDLAGTRARVAAQVVGRERELELTLAAVAAGRDVLLEGPPGTSKTTILTAITKEWGIPLFFVEGNADLTPTKLVGHHNPARVLREDYSADNFEPGPLLQAMESGGFLYIEELNRAPEDTLNMLLTAMADRSITVPRVGTVTALPSFRIVASMNPFDNVGTARLSTSVTDRLNRVVVDYQDGRAEARIVDLRAWGGVPGGHLADGADRRAMASPEESPAGDAHAPRQATGNQALRRALTTDAVAVTRATRDHPDVRQGSSVRGAIDTAMIAGQLADIRGITAREDESYPAMFYDAMTVGLSARIHVDEAAETSPERVLREIWEDHFILNPHAAAPG